MYQPFIRCHLKIHNNEKNNKYFILIISIYMNILLIYFHKDYIDSIEPFYLTSSSYIKYNMTSNVGHELISNAQNTQTNMQLT